MGGSAHEPFKSGVSVPYSSVFLLVLIPIDFRNQMFGDLVLPEPVLWVRMPVVRLNPFTCWGSALYFWDPSQLWSSHVCSKIMGKAMSLPFVPYSVCLSYPLLWGAASSAKILFFRNYSICSYKFVMSMGDEFRVLLCHHLQTSTAIFNLNI